MEDNEADFLPSDQQEELADLSLKGRWYFGPVLWSTDWTTQTIISQLDRGNINLNPRFQRRNAWSALKKSLFVESLILGLPIPQIILAEDHRKKGSFIVIDGKQRLLTLRQFMASPTDSDFTQLVLDGLEDRQDLNGKTWNDLQTDLALTDDRNSFENQTIRTVVIRNWKEDKYLYSVFLRINTGSVQLSPQELRQALFPGPFSDFIDDFSTSSEPLKKILGLREPDFRMRDVELVLRFFAYQYFAASYSGDLKGFLDSAADFFNKSWGKERERFEITAQSLEDSIAMTQAIFGNKDAFRKWNGKTYERRINRAVFDIMTFYFSELHIADAAVKVGEKVKKEFERACESNSEFRSALETTTKSKDANAIRFGVWASVLSSVLGFKVESPL